MTCRLLRGAFCAAIISFLLAGCQIAPAPPASSNVTLEQTLARARAASERGDTAEMRRLAISALERFPGAPELAEAQWLLASSYERDRAVNRAVEEYRQFLRNYPNDPRNGEARGRIKALTPRTARRESVRRAAVQLAWAPPTAAARAELLQGFADQGIDTVIIKGFRNRQDPPYGGEPADGAGSGVYFSTTAAPTLQNLVEEMVDDARQTGLSVFVWMPVRAMDWAVEAHPDWQDWSFDPATGTLHPSGRLDLWRPDVQDYIVRLLGDLAETGIDGLLLGEDLFVGEHAGLSPAARTQFAAEFQVTPTSELFWGSRSSRRPLFWRWAGWKSRSIAEQLASMLGRVRADHPALSVAQNVMPEAVTAPSDALARWGAELLTLAPAVDYVALLTYSSIGTDDIAALVARAVPLAGGADRIMVKVALTDRATGRRLPDEQVRRFVEAAGKAHAPGVVYLYNSGAIHGVPHRPFSVSSRLDKP